MEFVYLLPASKMARSGHFSFLLPQFDIPVNHLFLSLFMPKLYVLLVLRIVVALVSAVPTISPWARRPTGDHQEFQVAQSTK